MWPWIKRWQDWAMNNLWPITRISHRPQALHFSFEKAGLTLHDQAIPWNAEAVQVEVLLLPSPHRSKADFKLRLGAQFFPAEGLRREEGSNQQRLFFRVPTPTQSVSAEVLWRNTPLGQLTLPVLGHEEFLTNLRVQLPTLFARIGKQSIACQTFVSSQCKGLMASIVLTSPTSLVPLLDMGLQVEFRSERTCAVVTIPAPLTSSQLTGKQALVTVVPPKLPRRIDTWSATWKLGDRILVTQRARAISQRQFQRSLRISDTRFVVQSEKEGVRLRKQLLPTEEHDRVGPCFLVSSAEPGMAGLCILKVHPQFSGTGRPPALLEQEVLITDGPTMFAPGTVETVDLKQISGFELRVKETLLGILSLRPAPTAMFNSEGGFKQPEEFLWSGAAEEELTDRLTKLMEGQGKALGERGQL